VSGGAFACESMGLFGLSVAALASSPSLSGCADGCLGHSNSDFESIGLPSYQHLRPSMRRQDQYPCELDGIAALHGCLAKASGIGIERSAAMDAERMIE
jgi:hypothetical protein